MSVVNPNYPPQTVIVYTQTAWSRFWSWIGWLGFIVTGLVCLGLLVALSDYFDTTHGIEEKFVSGDKTGDEKIAVITVSGVIMEGDGFVKHQIDKVRDDKHVKAVVVRVDSPGGTVSGSDYIFHHLKKLRDDKGIPLVVSMGGMAASGGYYVSMAVGDKPDTIFAEPTCTTGSIGVMIPHYDISGLMKEYGVKDDSLATHPRKLMLSMTREMTSEERELAQSHINDMFDRFKAIVKEGRPHFKDNPADLDKLATGEIFTADKALANKLIDKIGFQEDAIDRALELASLHKDKTKIVKFKRPVSLSDSLLLSAPRGSAPGSFDLSALLDLSAPRAWFLCTGLPALITTRHAD
ncbi:MAG TPA: signal peptide peptidase SppA [Pirellulaceae bacterium]|nr:signal peptide peptidase SppA [Pirellulaceae bacterium]